MDEKTASSGAQVEQSTDEQSPTALGQELASEHREAYGTAKTENLRDSGLWRILLPGFIGVACLALLGTPLIILTMLFMYSEAQFIWLWVTMTVIELALVGFV